MLRSSRAGVTGTDLLQPRRRRSLAALAASSSVSNRLSRPAWRLRRRPLDLQGRWAMQLIAHVDERADGLHEEARAVDAGSRHPGSRCWTQSGVP